MRRNVVERRAREIFSSRFPYEKVIANYDRDDDILYINFVNSNAQKADFGRSFGDYIVRIKDGLVIGVTILNALSHLNSNFIDVPPILRHEPLVA